MLSKILPQRIMDNLTTHLNLEKVYEIRLRKNMPITINFAGKYHFLCNNGITDKAENALICVGTVLEEIIARSTNYSLYASNGQIKQGFITISGGIRLGICGEFVVENDKIKTIKNFSSINIRIPHEVKNCSLSALDYIIEDGLIKNTLIISPPGAGKTTFIRDFCYQLSMLNHKLNTLIIDERMEIASCENGVSQINVGNFADVYSGTSKIQGLEQGIRSMRPDLVIMDELATKEDVEAVEYAIGCGVSILATAHSKNVEELKEKKHFANAIKNNVFDRIVVLSSREGPGTFEGVFDRAGRLLYARG